jgi:hypothetical protein
MVYFLIGSTLCKNKKFMNLTLHENFVVSAECQSFSTSHGKSACDAIQGTTKSLAATNHDSKTVIRFGTNQLAKHEI